MRSRRSIAVALASAALVAAAAAGWRAARGQASEAPAPYQGQNVGRYQMFFSAFARADTFLVDTANGRVWQQCLDDGGNELWQSIAVSPAPQAGAAGEYRIYYSGKARTDTYLVDTTTGEVRRLIQLPTGQVMFKREAVDRLWPAAPE